MADSSLTQVEADALIALEKRRVDERVWRYPDFGGAVTIPLVSTDRREPFLLDLRRSRIDLAKDTYQNRGRQIVVLVRLDLGAKPHRNPDGEEIGSPHLHVYREGFGDKWAYPPPTDRFADLKDPRRILEDFIQFCNVVEPPVIRRGLFT